MQREARPPAWAVFTDGSCWHKDRVGGWAFVAIHEDDDEELVNAGGEADTTISRMELMGPLKALTWLLELAGPCWVLVRSDSEYVVKGITDRSRARMKHHDLWHQLDAVVDAHAEVQFEHVKGHAESYYNDLADKLAGEARKAKQDESYADSLPR